MVKIVSHIPAYYAIIKLPWPIVLWEHYFAAGNKHGSKGIDFISKLEIHYD